MMDDEAQLDVDNLHALRDMYEGYYAALDEYDSIQKMKLDIESFEMMEPKIAAAYHEEQYRIN